MSTKQVVVFFPHRSQMGRSTPPIDVERKPDRVWTLFHRGGPDDPPKTPIAPQHHVNAFLEDYVHDWNWTAGKLRYYSRVTEGEVWLLLEYRESKTVGKFAES